MCLRPGGEARTMLVGEPAAREGAALRVCLKSASQNLENPLNFPQNQALDCARLVKAWISVETPLEAGGPSRHEHDAAPGNPLCA